jgi:hypothetical protein
MIERNILKLIPGCGPVGNNIGSAGAMNSKERERGPASDERTDSHAAAKKSNIKNNRIAKV